MKIPVKTRSNAKWITAGALPLWLLASTAYAAVPDLSFTVNASEAVTVTGSPQLVLDVGGVTRYATYASGSGSSTLVFTYSPQVGDVDLNGIAITSPLNLNSGTITDLAGNSLSPLSFTLPNTSNVKVDYPSLSMDFLYDADGRYSLNGTSYDTLTPFLTAAGGSFSRTSTATYINSSGVMQTAASGVPRFDYDPTTLQPKGLLLEQVRTNSLRNGNVLGSVAGTPGTLPTRWFPGGSGLGTLTQQVVGSGTENGISYVDIRLYGTASTMNFYFYLDATNFIPALLGQAWSASVYTKLVTGTTNNAAVKLDICERDSSSNWITNSTTPLSSTGTLTRTTLTRTLTNASTAYVILGVSFTFTVGQPVDITLRIGGAQLESGPFATSYIPTTGAAATRAAETLLIPTGGWYNQSAGSFYEKLSWVSASGTNFPMFWRVDDTTSNNRWDFLYGQSLNVLSVDGYNLGTTQGSFSVASSTSGSAKIAAAQSLNSANAAFNGALSALDTGWTPPTVTRFFLGNNAQASVWISGTKYYPLRMADAQLQLISQ